MRNKCSQAEARMLDFKFKNMVLTETSWENKYEIWQVCDFRMLMKWSYGVQWVSIYGSGYVQTFW